MRADEIRELSEADLQARIAELEEERFRLKFRAATETLGDPLRLRSIRKDIARMKTVLRERTQPPAAGAPATRTATQAGAATGTKGATTGRARAKRAGTRR